MIVDTHAHVFARSLPVLPDARYVPGYDATIAQYLALLDAHGVDCGVLVQPSFLGTDNRHLLNALAAAPHRLRGVAVLDTQVTAAEIEALHDAGVRGVRFNLFKRRSRPALDSAAWRSLFERIAMRNWHVEVHDEGEALVDLLTQLRACPAPLVVDHLGRPGTDAAANDAVEHAIAVRADAGAVFVKVSAPYRGDHAAMARAAAGFRQRLGAERLLWGSDWPWTNFERRHDYAQTLAWLQQLVPAPPDRQAMHAAALRLFDFAR